MKAIVVLCGVILLSGCGQKGPLYFAPEPEAAVTPVATSAESSAAPAAAESKQDTDSKTQDQ